MKAVLSVLALAGSVLAGHGGGGGGDGWGGYTSTVYTTTSVCPITKTHTEGGS